MPEKLAPALVSTDMDEGAMVYGGNERLVATLRQVLSAKPAVVFVVTACPPGLIGDDVESAIAQAQPVSPATRIIPLKADGNLSGGFSDGWLDACQQGAAALIDPSRRPADDTVNLVGETVYGGGELNYRQIAGLLAALDLRVNTRFVQRASLASLEGFCRGRLNLLAGSSVDVGPTPAGIASPLWLGQPRPRRTLKRDRSAGTAAKEHHCRCRASGSGPILGRQPVVNGEDDG